MEDAAVSMLSYDKMNVFDKPNEQNGACINSAMARKGGCEETKFFHSQLQSVPQHACLYQKGLHLGYMITAYYYYHAYTGADILKMYPYVSVWG